MNRINEARLCGKCSKKFKVANWNKDRVFCSKECYWYAMKGKSHNHRTANGIIPWNKGLKGFMVGKHNAMWKGDKVGNVALHMWVARYLGKPHRCDFCNATKAPKMKKRWFEWANKSGEYKRDLTDWLRLCVPCHRKYDNVGNKAWITRRGRCYA